MAELQHHSLLVTVALFLAAPTALLLGKISAPYGRHERGGWGPGIPVKMGWVVMEWPASIGFLGLYFLGSQSKQLVPLLLLALWQIHYFHRTWVFPFRIKPSGKHMPLVVALMGMGWQCLNTYLCARSISEFSRYDPSWLTDSRFIGGALLFLIGMGINLHSDTVLIHLRKPGETGYKIPTGGLYRWVSCPNYLGEILEWTGWAIASWSMAGAAFAVFTAANLVPRALTHHHWYQQKFAEYPHHRRAIVPFFV